MGALVTKRIMFTKRTVLRRQGPGREEALPKDLKGLKINSYTQQKFTLLIIFPKLGDSDL